MAPLPGKSDIKAAVLVTLVSLKPPVPVANGRSLALLSLSPDVEEAARKVADFTCRLVRVI